MYSLDSMSKVLNALLEEECEESLSISSSPQHWQEKLELES